MNHKDSARQSVIHSSLLVLASTSQVTFPYLVYNNQNNHNFGLGRRIANVSGETREAFFSSG